MEAWDYWRALNMSVAVLSFIANAAKAYRFKFWHTMKLDELVGFIAVLGLLAGYFTATLVAWMSGIPAGPWTGIMTAPIVWSLIAAIIGFGKPLRVNTHD